MSVGRSGRDRSSSVRSGRINRGKLEERHMVRDAADPVAVGERDHGMRPGGLGGDDMRLDQIVEGRGHALVLGVERYRRSSGARPRSACVTSRVWSRRPRIGDDHPHRHPRRVRQQAAEPDVERRLGPGAGRDPGGVGRIEPDLQMQRHPVGQRDARARRADHVGRRRELALGIGVERGAGGGVVAAERSDAPLSAMARSATASATSSSRRLGVFDRGPLTGVGRGQAAFRPNG